MDRRYCHGRPTEETTSGNIHCCRLVSTMQLVYRVKNMKKKKTLDVKIIINNNKRRNVHNVRRGE